MGSFKTRFQRFSDEQLCQSLAAFAAGESGRLGPRTWLCREHSVQLKADGGMDKVWGQKDQRAWGREQAVAEAVKRIPRLQVVECARICKLYNKLLANKRFDLRDKTMRDWRAQILSCLLFLLLNNCTSDNSLVYKVGWLKPVLKKTDK